MQVDVSKNVPHAEKRPYLRVAARTTPKNPLSFFYIGTDVPTIRSLSENFEFCICAPSFEAAQSLIRSNNFDTQLDAVIIDIPHQAGAIKRLRFSLKMKGVSYTTPIIYNAPHLQDGGHDLLKDNIIDDVINLNSWHYNLSTKISFLKKAREHQFNQSFPRQTIKPKPQFFKRAFDILVASLLLLVSLPLFLLIAIAIKISTKGPVFYNAQRAGRGFKVFTFYKFRTMEVNADKRIEDLAHLNQYDHATKGAKFFKLANDPRVTKVGKLLRNSSLDELPQLFNVLKGDMSLVGNRPLPLYEAATLTTNEFVERFMAPAGITGLWQIKKRGNSEMSVEERISLDISYARKSDLLYDLWIVACTPKALLQKTNV